MDGADKAPWTSLPCCTSTTCWPGRGGSLLLTAERAAIAMAAQDRRPRIPALPQRRPSPSARPTTACLEAVLAKQFADRQLEIGQEVLDLLLRRIERSFAAARRAVDILDSAALAGRRRITAGLVRELVAEGAFEQGRG